MPILVATDAPPPADPGGGQPGDIPGHPRPVEVGPRLTWTSAEGRVTELEDFRAWTEGLMTLPGVRGLGMPSWTFFEDASPAFDGATVRGTPRAQPRDVTVPVHVWAATRAAFLARWRAWVSDLNPQSGQGLLTAHERDGTSRSIPAYYSQGLEGSGTDDGDGDGPTWFTAAAVFHCARPFWLGDERSVTFDMGGTGEPFYPFLPLRVVDSSPGGAVQLRNGGNTIAYPVWTITGPCSSITLTNETTGKSLRIDYALTAGDTLVIDTTDGAKYVQLNSDVNLWPAVALGSTLWPLQGGTNRLTLAAPNATDTTSITAAFRERFLTA